MANRDILDKPIDKFGWEYRYDAEILGDVVTMPEAELLWNKTRDTLYLAWALHKIEARKTVTDGGVLITVRSLVILYGDPALDLVKQLQRQREKSE